MKLVTLFLVLSLVVLMAEPGDAFFHHIIRGIVHVGRTIHGWIRGRRGQLMDQDAAMFNRERDFH